MFAVIYSIIQLIVVAAVVAAVVTMLARLIFSYRDPNPFGKVGRFAYKLRKATERFVFPAERLLMQFRIDIRFAPLIVILAVCLFAYFGLNVVWSILATLEGITRSLADGNMTRLLGSILVGFLGIYSSIIIARIIFAYFLSYSNKLMKFLVRVTDPILLPFSRIIPRIGMFDISALIVLLLLGFVRTILANALLG